MSTTPETVTRRDALKSGAVAAAALTIPSLISAGAYAADDSTVQLALVGCGGRGTGAAANALSAEYGPTRLVAMADVFENRLAGSYSALNRQFEKQMDVPDDRKFIGFDAFNHAMEVLRPGDVVILTTPPAFRWVHFKQAIDRGLNVFMEKPVTVDGASSRKMLGLYEEAKAKNLKVGVGLMCRHCVARGELFDRIQNGEIGDLTLLRAYRQAGPTGSAFVDKNDGSLSELMYQIKNFHGFLWASGGAFSDFLIHNIDECCWMKNDWPVEAKAAGGRHYRMDNVDQNFDNYSVEYTFADGAKLFLEGRCMPGAHKEFASYAHGTKGSAVISTASHAPSKARIYKGQHIDSKEHLVWAYPQPEPNPYQLEWNDLLKAIREDLPYNEVERGVKASLVTSMGRMAAHTGQLITMDQALNNDLALTTSVDTLTLDGPAPLLADADGKYPIPMPGLKKTEY